MANDVVRDLDDDALVARLEEAREELFNLRFQNATGQLTNTARIAQVKREIARCLTEARAREIAAADALAQQES
jgi:large subunit ribosomal protein L29